MTLIPPLERELIDAAKRKGDGRQRPRRRRLRTLARAIPALAAVLVVIIVAGGAVVVLGAHDHGSAGQAQRTHEGRSNPSSSHHRGHEPRHPATFVHVQVVHADRYCTSRHGYLIELCPLHAHGLVRLGGVDSEWLVLFTITAPISVHKPDYYYHTANAPPGCPNASQFGEYDQPVLKGQTVTQYAAFAKGCPGLGHGTISIVAPHHGRSAPRAPAPVGTSPVSASRSHGTDSR